MKKKGKIRFIIGIVLAVWGLISIICSFTMDSLSVLEISTTDLILVAVFFIGGGAILAVTGYIKMKKTSLQADNNDARPKE